MLLKAAWNKRRLALSQTADPAQLRRTFQVTTVSYQLVFLPVWVALAEREADQGLVLVNGQSGKVILSSRLRRKAPR